MHRHDLNRQTYRPVLLHGGGKDAVDEETIIRIFSHHQQEKIYTGTRHQAAAITALIASSKRQQAENERG